MYRREKEIYIKRTLWHQRVVVDLMSFLELNRDRLPFTIAEWSLMQRAVVHDIDKFRTEYSNALVDGQVKGLVGIEAHKQNVESMGGHNHYLLNTHHIDYHIEKNTFPSDLDICEMCCDWIAASHKSYNNDIDRCGKKLSEIILDKKYQTTIDFIKPQYEKFLSVIDLLEQIMIEKSYVIQPEMSIIQINSEKC